MPQVLVRTRYEALLEVTPEMFPIMILPSFTLNGAGRAIGNDFEDFNAKLDAAFDLSPTHEALLVHRDPE